MNFSFEINQVIDWTGGLVAVCILIDTLEKFSNFREFREAGLFDWERVRQFHGFSHRRPIIRHFADAVFGLRVWFTLLSLRGMAAAALLVGGAQNGFSPIFLLILLAVGSLENFRRMPFQPETPNRFTLPIIGALFLQTLVPTEIVTEACLWFIALQSCLSYVTAGIAKLFNQDWLKGNGVLHAFNSPYYIASPKLAGFLDRNRSVAGLLNHLTLVIEICFPLVLIVGRPYFMIFLIWGLFFHITNAVLFRLNNYFWPWVATYPAIFYLAQG